MTTEPQDTDQEPERVGGDLIIPVAGLLLAIYYFTTIIDSAWTARVTFYLVGVTLIGLALVYIFKTVGKIMTGSAVLDFSNLAAPLDLLPRRAILFALTLGSIIVMPYIGFTLTAMIYLAATMLLLNDGRNAAFIVILSVFLSVLWFTLFVLIFDRHFPIAWLDGQIKYLFVPILKLMGIG